MQEQNGRFTDLTNAFIPQSRDAGNNRIATCEESYWND